MGLQITLTAKHWHPDVSRTYGFDVSRIVIGRWLGSDVCIPDPEIEYKHVQLQEKSGQWSVEDQDSLNGLILNGSRIAPRCERKIKSGDLLEIGSYQMRVVCGAAVSSPTTHEQSQIWGCQMLRWIRRESAMWGPIPPALITWEGAHGIQERFEFDRPGLRRVYGPNRVSHDLDGIKQDNRVSHDLDRIKQDNRVSHDLDPHIDASRWLEFVYDTWGVRVQASSVDQFQCQKKMFCQKPLVHGDEIQFHSLHIVYSDPSFERMRALEQVASELHQPPAQKTGVEVSASAPISPPTRHPSRAGSIVQGVEPETLVYVLAAVVFALSLAGLVVMMKSIP